VLATFATIRPAAAHPLGNNSITHFSVLYVLPDRVEIDFYLDIAEDPTRYIEMTEMDDDGDSQVTREEQETWLEEKTAEYREQMHLKVDGRTLPVVLIPEERPRLIKLVTARLSCRCSVPWHDVSAGDPRRPLPAAPGPGTMPRLRIDLFAADGSQTILLEHTHGSAR
jgi:hypothetical protein